MGVGHDLGALCRFRLALAVVALGAALCGVPSAAAAPGYWELAARKAPAQSRFSDGAFQVVYELGANEMRRQAYEGNRLVLEEQFSWSPFPGTLAPGQTLQLRLQATPVKRETPLHEEQPLVALFDRPGAGPAAPSGSAVVAGRVASAAAGAGGATGSLTASTIVPFFGFGDSRETESLSLYIGTREVQYESVYRWRSGPPPAAVLPAAPPAPATPVPAPSPAAAPALGSPCGSPDLFVASLYRTLLGREPDPAGHQMFVGKLASGTPREKLYGDFLASPEYQSKGKPDAEYIRDCYRALLARVPSEAEVAFWAGQLQKGKTRRADLPSVFQDTPEYKALRAPCR